LGGEKKSKKIEKSQAGLVDFAHLCNSPINSTDIDVRASNLSDLPHAQSIHIGVTS
jgi:hypothetical protein